MFTRDFNRECKSGNIMIDEYGGYSNLRTLFNGYSENEDTGTTSLVVPFWWSTIGESWWCEYSDGGI